MTDIKKITQDLEQKIEQCNKDPAFTHPLLSFLQPNYLPLRVNPRAFPSDQGDYTEWSIWYEIGKTHSTGVSYLYFFSDPATLTGWDKEKQEWIKDNPTLDFTKPIYEVPKVPSPHLVTNDYQEALKELYSQLDYIATTRKP